MTLHSNLVQSKSKFDVPNTFADDSTVLSTQRGERKVKLKALCKLQKVSLSGTLVVPNALMSLPLVPALTRKKHCGLRHAGLQRIDWLQWRIQQPRLRRASHWWPLFYQDDGKKNPLATKSMKDKGFKAMKAFAVCESKSVFKSVSKSSESWPDAIGRGSASLVTNDTDDKTSSKSKKVVDSRHTNKTWKVDALKTWNQRLEPRTTSLSRETLSTWWNATPVKVSDNWLQDLPHRKNALAIWWSTDQNKKIETLSMENKRLRCHRIRPWPYVFRFRNDHRRNTVALSLYFQSSQNQTKRMLPYASSNTTRSSMKIWSERFTLLVRQSSVMHMLDSRMLFLMCRLQLNTR